MLIFYPQFPYITSYCNVVYGYQVLVFTPNVLTTEGGKRLKTNREETELYRLLEGGGGVVYSSSRLLRRHVGYNT